MNQPNIFAKCFAASAGSRFDQAVGQGVGDLSGKARARNCEGGVNPHSQLFGGALVDCFAKDVCCDFHLVSRIGQYRIVPCEKPENQIYFSLHFHVDEQLKCGLDPSLCRREANGAIGAEGNQGHEFPHGPRRNFLQTRDCSVYEVVKIARTSRQPPFGIDSQENCVRCGGGVLFIMNLLEIHTCSGKSRSGVQIPALLPIRFGGEPYRPTKRTESPECAEPSRPIPNRRRLPAMDTEQQYQQVMKNRGGAPNKKCPAHTNKYFYSQRKYFHLGIVP